MSLRPWRWHTSAMNLKRLGVATCFLVGLSLVGCSEDEDESVPRGSGGSGGSSAGGAGGTAGSAGGTGAVGGTTGGAGGATGGAGGAAGTAGAGGSCAPVTQCGWDASQDLYQCGFQGADPGGTVRACPAGLGEGSSDCKGLPVFGGGGVGQYCCDANGDLWGCIYGAGSAKLSRTECTTSC